VAHGLAGAGAAVVVGDLDTTSAEATAAAITDGGGRAIAHQVDVGDPGGCAGLMDAAAAVFGGLHVLYNGAGVAWADRDGPTHRLDPAVWDAVLRVNLSGTFYCCHHAMAHLQASGGGSIVNTASSVAVLPNASLDAYAASKGGVATLTRSMAMSAGQRGVRVNAICPGYVDTPMNAAIFANDAIRRAFELGHATGLQTPEEIADLVVFLASDASRSLTGAVITCDRGWASFKLPDMLRGHASLQ
jgi:NAD(P)-dependent dehydrogenase (short-subunit alcohol dehydrogenase family)